MGSKPNYFSFKREKKKYNKTKATFWLLRKKKLKTNRVQAFFKKKKSLNKQRLKQFKVKP